MDTLDRLIVAAVPAIREEHGSCTIDLLCSVINLPRSTMHRRVQKLRQGGHLIGSGHGALRVNTLTSVSPGPSGHS